MNDNKIDDEANRKAYSSTWPTAVGINGESNGVITKYACNETWQGELYLAFD